MYENIRKRLMEGTINDEEEINEEDEENELDEEEFDALLDGLEEDEEEDDDDDIDEAEKLTKAERKKKLKQAKRREGKAKSPARVKAGKRSAKTLGPAGLSKRAKKGWKTRKREGGGAKESYEYDGFALIEAIVNHSDDPDRQAELAEEIILDIFTSEE